MSGTTAAVFLIPLLLVISIATFAVTLTISMSPGEEEIQADAEMQRRMEYLQQRQDWSQVSSGPRRGWHEAPPMTDTERPCRKPSRLAWLAAGSLTGWRRGDGGTGRQSRRCCGRRAARTCRRSSRCGR